MPIYRVETTLVAKNVPSCALTEVLTASEANGWDVDVTYDPMGSRLEFTLKTHDFDALNATVHEIHRTIERASIA